MSGRLLSWERDQAVLIWYSGPQGNLYEARREQTVRIPRRDIDLVELKRLDGRKTGLVIAGGAALVVLSVLTLFDSDPGGSPPSNSPRGDVSFDPGVPLISW